MKDLVGTGAEQTADRTFLLPDGVLQIAIEVVVETSLPGDRTEDDFAEETRVGRGMTGLAVEQGVRVSAGFDPDENFGDFGADAGRSFGWFVHGRSYRFRWAAVKVADFA